MLTPRTLEILNFWRRKPARGVRRFPVGCGGLTLREFGDSVADEEGCRAVGEVIGAQLEVLLDAHDI
jgi:hypothetical protein